MSLIDDAAPRRRPGISAFDGLSADADAPPVEPPAFPFADRVLNQDVRPGENEPVAPPLPESDSLLERGGLKKVEAAGLYKRAIENGWIRLEDIAGTRARQLYHEAITLREEAFAARNARMWQTAAKLQLAIEKQQAEIVSRMGREERLDTGKPTTISLQYDQATIDRIAQIIEGRRKDAQRTTTTGEDSPLDGIVRRAASESEAVPPADEHDGLLLPRVGPAAGSGDATLGELAGDADVAEPLPPE